jgi:hypothetical protein
VLIVRNDVARVESDLVAGLVACPGGDGFLRPWGHGRARVLRGEDRESAFRPRRGRCGSCLVTQVLLPDWCLARRRDRVEVVGSALMSKVSGEGHRRIAKEIDVPEGTATPAATSRAQHISNPDVAAILIQPVRQHSHGPPPSEESRGVGSGLCRATYSQGLSDWHSRLAPQGSRGWLARDGNSVRSCRPELSRDAPLRDDHRRLEQCPGQPQKGWQLSAATRESSWIGRPSDCRAAHLGGVEGVGDVLVVDVFEVGVGTNDPVLGRRRLPLD